MKGIFCSTKAKTNEEYRKELKKKNVILGGVALLGLATLCVALYAHLYQLSSAEHILGYFAGVGSGLLAGCLILLIKNVRIMKDENRLKNERLKNSDERIDAISKRSFRAASAVMVVAAYLICLIGGIFHPILFKILSLLMAILIFSYIVSYRFYDSRM